MHSNSNLRVYTNDLQSWPISVRRAVDCIASVLMASLMLCRARAAGHVSTAIKAFAERDGHAWHESLLRREVDLLRSRLESIPPPQRPHYGSENRFAILQLMRLRNWSIEQTAQRFVLHPNTIRGWLKSFCAEACVGNFFGAAPFNKISGAGRWLVHQIRELCPDSNFGTRSIALAIRRAGVQLSRTSVQRILRECKPAPPPQPATPQSAAEPGIPRHILRPGVPNRTWHLDLTTFEFLWIRFYIAAVLDGVSRKLLALKVFADAPSTADMRRLIQNCCRTFGAPRFLVTDHGCQFRKRLKAAVGKLGIALVKGRKDSKQFNGKVERFFRTFKLWQRVTVFAWSREKIQRRLDVYRNWYNTERPMWLHGGRTPEEVWSDVALNPAHPIRENDPLRPAVGVTRLNFRNDCALPQLNIQIVRSVKRAA